MNFKSFSTFDDKFVASYMYKVKVKFNKPIYVEFLVLDLSTLSMYEFCYKVK